MAKFESYYKYTQHLHKGLQNLVFYMEGYRPDTLDFLRERFSLKDLDRSAISNLTQKHFDARMTDPEFNSGMRVIEAQWSTGNGTFTIFFEMEPTKGSSAKVLTPQAREYQGTFYNVVFQFLDVNKWFGEPDEFQQKTPDEQVKIIDDMIWKSECKIHSNDPSFYYQGMWEDLAGVDGTIFGFPGPKGDGVWRNRHAQSGGLAIPQVRITKHMAQVIGNIDKMVSEIRDKTRVVA